mmetsp:Transcript_40686/g.100041  ORF Transcript_40686/g.100041 Transcript_40686/m.100041 type:complete len:110 (-) Transcript_40686:178-507(-)
MPWVTIRIDSVESSPSCHRRSSSERRFSAVRTSRALKGSSIQRISGSTARARANPTRCRIPPDSSFGKAVSYPSKPIISMTLSALLRRSAFDAMPWIPISTFSSTVSHG